METVQLLIADRDAPASTGATFTRTSPLTGQAEFTDLRWITIQTTPRHYPF